MRIAVTATGGGVGQSILKALKGSDYEVIALDSDRLGAGLYMVPESYLIPRADDKQYIPGLLKLCKEKKIELLFPGMDCELTKLSRYKSDFWHNGTRVSISPEDIIDLANDKLMIQTYLKDNGFPFIKTVTTCDNSDKWSCSKRLFVKPRFGGARSKDAKIIDDITDINWNDLDGMVIQEIIEGDEYTCGTLTLEGRYKGCIIMRRILRDGDTYKCFVERNETIENLCRDICNTLKPEGAFNIQLKLKDGVPYVFEFNARSSGTTAARALAGFNEPKMIADYYLKGIEPRFEIKELNILRYWNELIVPELK